MVIWEHNEEKGMFRIILYNDQPFHPPGFSVETVKSKEQLVSFMLDIIDIYQLKAPPKRMLDILQTYTEKQMPYRPYLQYSRYRSLMGSDNVEQLFKRTAMALQSTTIEKDFPIWKSQEALSLATQSSLFRDMMKFNRFPELPVEMKLQIIKKCWVESYVRLHQTCRSMDELCNKTRRQEYTLIIQRTSYGYIVLLLIYYTKCRFWNWKAFQDWKTKENSI